MAALIATATASFVDAADPAPVAETPESAPAKSVAGLFESLAPAIVRVRLIGEDLDAEKKPIVWYVTGFIITPEGRILSSLGPSTRIQRAIVEKDGLEYAADFLGGDLRTRLALIQLLKTPEKIAVIPLPSRADDKPPAIGTPIVAISHPVLLEVGPLPGWVTGYESAYAQNIFPCTYLRTNISLGPGETGSPTVDMHGNLVGILNHGVAEFRASYAVTLSSIRRVVHDLNKTGHVNYGTLPVEFAEAPDRLFVVRQVIISSVVPDSTAARAGLKPGDVLRRLTLLTEREVEIPGNPTNGADAPIRRMSDVRDVLFHALPGEFVRIEIERDGQVIPFFTLPVEALRDDSSSASNTPGSGKNG